MGRTICFKSREKIEHVACLISKKLFEGIKFGGLNEYIHEEVPAVYVSSTIMGFRITLDGMNNCYCLNIDFSSEAKDFYKKDLNKCLFLNEGFIDYIKFLISTIPEFYEIK